MRSTQPFVLAMGTATLGCWLIGYWLVFPGWDAYGEQACVRSAAGRWIASWIALPYARTFELFRCGDTYNVLLSWYYVHLGAFTVVGAVVFWRAYRKDIVFSRSDAFLLGVMSDARWILIGAWFVIYCVLSGGYSSLGQNRGFFGHLLMLALGFGALPTLALFIGWDAIVRRAKRRGRIDTTESFE